jgi:hypothetical protein
MSVQVVIQDIHQPKPHLVSEVVGLETAFSLDRYTAILQRWNE